MDFSKVKEYAKNYEKDMTKFLRDLVAIPGESAEEKGHVMRIKEEMEKLGFDEVVIDEMGNILGYMGKGEKLIGYDAHIDTVGIGNRSNWNFDPYEGFESETEIGGRGVSDQLGGIVSAVYGAKIMKDLDILNDKYRVVVVGSVQEEDCDGLCWQYIINEDKVHPEFVVSTEPTDGGIYRGQRGRMEIRVDVKGVSCHGSAPEKGDNAIYKMAEIIHRIENKQKEFDKIDGEKGSIVISNIEARTASLNAVPDMCTIYIDRRLALGETEEKVNEEMEAFVEGIDAKYEIYNAVGKSYTDKEVILKVFLPAWEISKDHHLTKSAIKAYEDLFAEKAVLFKLPFATNGFAANKEIKIPTIVFGPGNLKLAHMKDEKCKLEDIYKTISFYSLIAEKC